MRIIFIIALLFLIGCATARPALKPSTSPSPELDPAPTEKAEIVLPETTPVNMAEEPPAPEPEPLTKGSIFAKSVFEGVVKTSYVQLTFVDRADEKKSYQLIIGDKARQKNFPWNIQTVRPGYFFIDLPAGSYRMTRMAIPVGSTLAVEPMDVTFDVLEGKTVYLGTLFVRGDKERIKLGGVPIIRPGFEYTLQVKDERQEALAEITQRFTDFNGELTYRLMTAAFPSNRDLPTINE